MVRPRVWEILGRGYGVVGRIVWEGGGDVQYHMGPNTRALLANLLAGPLKAPEHLREKVLDHFFSAELIQISRGECWAVAIDAKQLVAEQEWKAACLADGVRPTPRSSDDRYSRNVLPADLTVASLRKATQAGEVVWAVSESGGYKAGGAQPGGRPMFFIVFGAGGAYTMTVTQGMSVLVRESQRDGWFGWKRCALRGLFETIRASTPGPVAPAAAPDRRGA